MEFCAIRANERAFKAHAAIFLVLALALLSFPVVGENSAAYSNSKTIEATCDAAWPAMLSAVTANGFAPALSDRVGGVLKASYMRGESLYRGAKKDMNALTLNRYSGWTVIEKFRVEDVVVTVVPSGNSCSVTMHVQYATLVNNLLQKGWVALESSGRLQWMMLAETDHIATGAAKPSTVRDQIQTVRKEQTTRVATPGQSEVPKGIVVRFTSLPSDAEVRVDGEYWGSTPTVDLTGIPPGPHTIVVKKSGYLPWERKITLAPGDERIFKADLQPAPNDGTKPRIVGND